MRRTPVQGREVDESEPADVAHADAAYGPRGEGVDPRANTATPDEARVRQRGAWIVLATLVVAAAVAVLAVVTLGRGSTAPIAQSDDIPGPSTPVAPVKADEREIVDTYLGYWEAQSEAFAAADPDYPPLAHFTTTAQLEVVRDAVKKVHDQGWATRAPVNSIAEQRVTVVSIDGDHARFRSCEIDDGFVIDRATGEPVNPDHGVGTGLWTGEMIRDGGVWKVSHVTRKQEWEGVAGCAVDG